MTDQLTDRWLATWTAMRQLRCTELAGWPLVHVRSATRRTELICVDSGVEALRALLPHVAADAEAMLTVVGLDLSAHRGMSLPQDVRVDRDDETLMTTAVTAVEVPDLPDDLVATWEIAPTFVHYRIEDGDRVVSEAVMGVHDRWATFDSVETARSHQRRGLARHVMLALTAHAHTHGARHGVLAASAGGRRLYEALGWTVQRELLSLMGVSSPPAGHRGAGAHLVPRGRLHVEVGPGC